MSATDYHIHVDELGDFRIARRTMRVELQMQVEYSRIVQGVQPSAYLDLLATWIAAAKVLVLKGPDGWDVDALDPLDQGDMKKLMLLNGAINAKEASFRGKTAKGGEAGGPGAVGNDQVLVPPEVQPTGN